MTRLKQIFVLTGLLWLMTLAGLAQRINGVAFDKLPQDYQLYPRNAQSEAQLPIAGRVAEAGWQQVAVHVFRNHQLVAYKRAAIAYTAGEGRFSVDPITIRAEKAEYDLVLYLVKNNDSTFVVNRTNIVSGDVYVFAGQSNASAYFKEPRTNEFCRTFGKTSGTYGLEPSNPADTTWALANQTLIAQDVGSFGFEFQLQILEKYGVPVCLINGAAHWSMMAHYAERTPGNPADLTNRYGRMLYRLQKGGLVNAVKAFVYRQGESEAYGEGNNWGGNFDLFYKNLKRDLPALRQLYVCQIDIIDPAVAAAPVVREAQRNLVNLYPDVQVLSTVGTPGFDGLHYSVAGYAQNALELFRLVARDFYQATDTDNIDAPNCRRAYYSNSDRTEVTVVFNDGQALVWTDQFENQLLKNNFYFDGVSGNVLSGRTSGNQVILTLKKPSSATRLTYLPPSIDPASPDFPYRGPYVTNKRGMRACSFYELPVPIPLPAPVVQATATFANAIALTWQPVDGADGYFIERRLARDSVYTVMAKPAASATRYADTLLNDNSRYTYRVKAIGTVRYTDSPPTLVTAQTPAWLATPELALTVLYNNAIRVDWTAVSGATAYQLERRGADAVFKPAGTFGTTALMVRDTNLVPGTGYTYRIKALGDRTLSPVGSGSATTPALLSSPVLSLSVVYNDAITVNWAAVANATAYQLVRTTPNQPAQGLGTFGTAARAFRDTSLTPGVAYTYRLLAVGDRTTSPVVSSSVATPALLASPVLSLSVVYNNAITAGWAAVPGATVYQLVRSAPNQPDQALGTLNAGARSFSDTSLIPGTRYTYRLLALGDRTTSTTVSTSATTPTLLDTPALQVTPTSYDRMRVNWQAVTGVTYYLLERQLVSTGRFQSPIRLAAQVQSYADSMLVPATAYRYRITAYGDKTQSAATVATETTLVLLATEPAPSVAMQLRPNPAAGGQTTVHFPAPVSGRLQVVDLRGAVQQQQTLTEAVQVPLSLVGYPAGIYLIRVERQSDVLVQQLLVR